MGTLTDFSVLDDSPLEPLYIEAYGGESREEDDSLQSDLFSFIMFRFGRPVEEGYNVFGHLGGSSRRALFSARIIS